MSKIAEQLESIITKARADILLKHGVPATDKDLALAIKLHILDAKPKKYQCPLHGANRLNSCNGCIMAIDKNCALYEWKNNLGGKR